MLWYFLTVANNRGPDAVIVLLTKTGPPCISFRRKITVSLAQGAVHDAEADVADPGFVRSTIETVFALPQSVISTVVFVPFLLRTGRIEQTAI